MLTNGRREVTEVLGNSGWTNGALALMLAFRIETKSSRNLLKSERAKQKEAAALNVYIRTGSCIQRLLLSLVVPRAGYACAKLSLSLGYSAWGSARAGVPSECACS